jgi:PAS domain S-box-containing protein
MQPPRILVVEDEGIVARDLQNKLQRLGYEVPAVVSSGEEAILKAQEHRPDLVLMDIVLKGQMDGIEAAAVIWERCRVPAVFLTAYGDDATLQRAKVTRPYGYVLKPFSERELRINIEVALYRNQMERKLQGMERWFSSALASMGDAVIETAADGRIVLMNRLAEELTGWNAAAASGRPVEEVLVLRDRQTGERPPDPARQALEEEALASLEGAVLAARSGAEIPVQLCAAPLRRESGEVRGAVLLFRDLSRLERAEEGLRQTEESFRLLVESVQDYAIFMLDPDGTVATWNRGAERITGFRAEEIVGRHFSVFHPDDADPRRELEVAAAGRYEEESQRVRKDGSRFWANVVVTPLHDDQGQVRGFAKVIRDITASRELETELRERAERLAEADRRKDQFLAMLAHELRNPLGAITNGLAVLDRVGPEEERAVKTRAIINRQVRHLSRMVDDLLDVSRLTRGLVELRKEPVEIAAAIADAEQTVRPLLEAKGHALAVSLPPAPIVLEADPARLEQIIGNLVGNAARYTPPGGKISICAEAVKEPVPAVVLRIKDTGVGIKPELLPRVFDLFTQADRSLARSEGGLGIGLTLVKGLVELHGGTVEAFSEGPGKGSEFVVRLPLRAAESVEELAPPGAPGFAPRKILVVEDNVDAAETLCDLLRAWGHQVQAALDGPTALRAASAFHPEVVLCDIGMPGMDGYEVARRLRAQQAADAPLLVAVTGYGQAEDLRRSAEAGFDHHFVKPVDPEGLLRLLSAAYPA